jgi:hypothetical protein
MQRWMRDIAPGQKFQKLGRGGVVWEVVSVTTDATGSTHARLRSEAEPKSFRTFAIEVLLDPRNFQPLGGL